MINVENRGRHKKAIAEKNREAVYSFFKSNPTAFSRDCQKETGLSAGAISRHVKAIRAGWVPGRAI